MKKYWSGTESYFVSAHWLAWLSGALRLWDIITPPLSDGPPHNPLCLHCISEALSIPHPSADSLNLISWCNLMEHADVNTKAFWCAPAEAYPGVVKKWNKSAHNPFSAIVLGADWPLAKKRKILLLNSALSEFQIAFNFCEIQCCEISFPGVGLQPVFLYSYPFLFFLSLTRFPWFSRES